MPRLPRLDPPGGIHHVTNRTARRFELFLDDRDRSFFIELLEESCEKFGVRVLAYALMGNHYHLVLQCPEGGVSNAGKLISENYTRAFNTTHGYDGPLFRDRFRSSLIDSDAYLLAATRYVHRNPLELGLQLGSYRWSSFLAYLNPATSPAWLDVSVALGLSGGPAEYRTYVLTDADHDALSVADGRFRLGPQPAVAPPLRSLSTIAEVVASRAGINSTTLHQSVRGKANLPRLIAVLIASDQRTCSPDDLATHFDLGSRSSVRACVARARRIVGTDCAARSLWEASLHDLQHGV